MARKKPTIEEIFDEVTPIGNAIGAGAREALIDHKRAGNPIVVWRDGKAVVIPPEEIEIPPEPPPYLPDNPAL